MVSEPLLGSPKVKNGAKKTFCQEHQSDWLALLLGPAISVPFAACYAALVCQPEPMKPYFPVVLQQIMWTQLVGAVLSLFLGQFTTTSNLDPLVAILFGQMAQRAQFVFQGEKQHALFLNMTVLMPLVTFILGMALYAVGRLRLAFMLRFFPYTVIGGFLAGSGLLILLESLSLSGGIDIWELLGHTLLGRGTEFASNWLQLLLGCLYAVLAGRARDHFTFGTPLLLVASVVASIAVQSLSSGTCPPPSWFLSYPEPVNWYAPFVTYREGVAVFSPHKIVPPEMVLSFVTIMTVSWSINTLAIKKLVPLRRGIRQCDEQEEIRTLGLSNMVLGLFGAHASMQSFKIPLMMKEVKAGDLWPFFHLAVTFVVFMASPRAIVETIPRFLFAGTVIRLASDLMIDWLIDARDRIAVNEWRILAVTAVAIAVNLTTGILFGLFMTLVHFAIEYSSVTGVMKIGDLRSVQSNIERSQEEHALIQQHGHFVPVIWLSGYLFFGSVTSAVDEVRKCLESNATIIIVLDLSLVPAMDASGVFALIDLIEEISMFNTGSQLVLCGLVRRLDLALRHAAERQGVEAVLFHNLDKALEYCEEQLFTHLAASGICTTSRTTPICKVESDGFLSSMAMDDTSSFTALWSQLLHRELSALDSDGQSVRHLCAEMVLRKFLPGDVVLQRGQPACGLLVLLAGSIEITQPSILERGGVNLNLSRHHLNEEKGDVYVFEERRTRRARRGAIFGAMEYVAWCDKGVSEGEDAPVFASTGRAVDHVQVGMITFEQLHGIECREPKVALVLRTWLSHLAVDALLAKRSAVNIRDGDPSEGVGQFCLKRKISM